MRKKVSVVLSTLGFFGCYPQVQDFYNIKFQNASQIEGSETIGIRQIPCSERLMFELYRKTLHSDTSFHISISVPKAIYVERLRMMIDGTTRELSASGKSHFDGYMEHRSFEVPPFILNELLIASDLIIRVDGGSSYVEERCIPTAIKYDRINAKYGIQKFDSLMTIR